MRMSARVGPGILVTWFAAASTVAYADPEVQALAMATGLIVLTTVATPERNESDHVAIEAGRFDAIKKMQPATTFGLEYRSGRLLWWRLRPFAGAGFTTQHSFYGYGGIRLATYWGEHIVATPSFAVGGYSRGAGKDLGNPPIVGRFGIDLGYRFQNDLLVGLAYHHISNGKLLGQMTNPGTEVVALTVSMPVQ
jgi:lipid A 3-O-deacylase PagL